MESWCVDGVLAVVVLGAVFTLSNLDQMPGGVEAFLATRVSLKNALLLTAFAWAWPRPGEGGEQQRILERHTGGEERLDTPRHLVQVGQGEHCPENHHRQHAIDHPPWSRGAWMACWRWWFSGQCSPCPTWTRCRGVSRRSSPPVCLSRMRCCSPPSPGRGHAQAKAVSSNAFLRDTRVARNASTPPGIWSRLDRVNTAPRTTTASTPSTHHDSMAGGRWRAGGGGSRGSVHPVQPGPDAGGCRGVPRHPCVSQECVAAHRLRLGVATPRRRR